MLEQECLLYSDMNQSLFSCHQL